MKQVIIMRGVSGSGKTTWIERNVSESAYVCSADNYFMKGDTYLFDARELGDAHAACLRLFVEHLQDNRDTVVVDNTNTTIVEIAPYYALAAAYGYDVRIVTVWCDVAYAARRNRHGATLAVVRAQGERILREENFPPFWTVRKEEVISPVGGS